MNTSDFIGSGGVFVADSIVTQSIPSGTAAGDILTITPPSGKRVVLMSLMSGNKTAAANANGTLKAGARVIAAGPFNVGAPESGTGNASFFSVGSGFWATAREVALKPDETLTLTSTIATNQVIIYSYAFGD